MRLNLGKRLAQATLLLSLSYPAMAEVKILDRIVAIIDDRAITQTELDGRVNEIVTRAAGSGVQLPPEDVIKQQVLDLLISETLQLNAASRYGVTPTDQEVDNAIAGMLETQGISIAQLTNEITRTGGTMKEFRASIRRQLTIQQISRGLVSSRIQVSDQEIDSFLKSADAQFWSSPDYNLGHILIPVPQSANYVETQNAEVKATRIYEELLNGDNFEAKAIAESKGPQALQGGDLGWRKTSALPTLFAQAVPSMEIGQISKPLRSQAGFHILKLKGKRGEEKQVVTQTDVSHILIKPNELLDNAQVKIKLSEIRQDVIAGEADFGDMAREYTDDIGTKLQGGNMGWSSPGLFVPEFEQTMDNTAIGQISEPFQTQFGWHILRVEDRREEDMTDEVLRSRAANVIRSRRFEDELQLWVQEMRDGAFIDVRI